MFQTSLPVTSQGFHDRTEALTRLSNAIDQLCSGHPKWIAILGNRKVGKTSLLLELARQKQSSSLRFVVFDIMELSPLSLEIFRLLGLRILDACLSEDIGASLESAANDPPRYRSLLLSSKAWNQLPKSVQVDTLELLDHPADTELVRLVLKLPEAIGVALNINLVVALDEFQELASLANRRGGIDVFPMMRSNWQRHQKVSYFVSGSARTMLTELVTAQHSPFFQHFDLMELGPFSIEDAKTLLMQAAPTEGTIPAEIAERGAELLGGHPFYVQLLGETLLRQPSPVDEGSLRASLQELLFSRTGRLALYFQAQFERLVGRSTYLSATLRALDQGPMRQSEISKKIGAASGATVRYLERLNDVIEKQEDGRYALSDPTFGLWLRWREPGGSVLPMTLLGDEAEKQVAHALSQMGFELVYHSRASRGAFDLLAIRQGIRLGIQVKRSPLPLRFKKSAWTRMEDDGKRFGWIWTIASVCPETAKVSFLDPQLATIGREIRVQKEAKIDNLLMWMAKRA